MNSDDELRNAASRIMAKRFEAKTLTLTCERCREYFTSARYEPHCDECREARRPT
jgi:hypothetical protein